MPTEYQTIQIPLPAKGLNKDLEPTFLIGATPNIKNMVIEATKVRKRLGDVLLGPASLPLTGIGMQLIKYVDQGGTKHLIALTTTDAYVYKSTDDTWTEITPVAGDFTGTDQDHWSFTTAHDTVSFTLNGGKALLISNGTSDAIYKYEGSGGDKFVSYDTNDLSTLVSTEDLLEFWNHLFLLKVDDGGGVNIQGIKVSDIGDLDNYTSGTSFFGTLTDSVGDIKSMVKFGQDAVIYSDESITLARYVGGQTLFIFPTMITELGLLMQKALHSFAGYHTFMSTDKRIYAYEGGVNVLSIGTNIEEFVFNLLDYAKRELIASGKDTSTYRMYFFIPDASNDYACKYVAANYKNKQFPWEFGEFGHDVRSMGLFDSAWAWQCSSVRFNTSPFTKCSAMVERCSASAGQDGFSQPILLDSTGNVYLFDESVGTDNAVDIACELETHDITIDLENHYFRSQWFTFNAMSSLANATVTVSYSTDGGVSFTELEDSPVSLGTNWDQFRLYLDVTSRKIRFKFEQDSDKDLQIRAMQLMAIPKTERLDS